MLILQIIFLLIRAIAVVGATIVGFIYLRQGVQLLRFRFSMRSFAENDAEEGDPALEIPKEKGTLEEEQTRLDAIWELFYRPGLSVAKLRASDRLREKLSFTRPEWIQWQEWRGYQKLATNGSSAAQKKSLAYARREAERQLQNLAVADIPLWLALYDEKEHPDLRLRWAKSNLRGSNKRFALQVLEELAGRNDEIGARALFDLFVHYAKLDTRFVALEYAKRHLDHPKKMMEPSIRQQLRSIFTPEIDEFSDRDSYWKVTASKGAKLIARVHALDVDAPEKVWLDDPSAPLMQAKLGARLWELELPPPALPFFSTQTCSFKLPDLEGPLQVELTAQYIEPALWSDCMGKEKMPVARSFSRICKTSMDAVLSLTENTANVWVVDKQKKSAMPNISVTLMRRDASGRIESQSSTTDENGLFVWQGKPTWQFGVLVERENAQGRKEQIFVTNNHDIKTSKEPPAIRRFYVMLARPLYRPGERIKGKLFARQKGHEGNSQKLSGGLVFQLEIYSPRGPKVTTIPCTLTEFGSAAFELPLPADAPLGKYTFRIAQNAAAVEGSFHVEEFVAPEFRAEIRSKDKNAWGKPSKLEFDGRYFFGGPVANARGTLEIKRSNWRYRNWPGGSFSKSFRAPKQLNSINFKTDAQGKAIIELPWKGPFDPFGRLDGCDFDFVATVRDASGKSCQATLHLSVPRNAVVVSAKPIRALRLPGETLPLRLSWQPEDATDESPRQLTIVCRKGWAKKTFVHQVRRADADFDLPLELPPGKWELSAFVEGQNSRARTKNDFTLLGPDLQQKHRAIIVSNDPTDSQGTIRVALMGPKTYCDKELLVWNRGSRLGSKVITRSSSTAWFELPFVAGKEEKVHISWWHFDSREEQLYRQTAAANIDPLDLATKTPVDLTLEFPAPNVRPGEETSLHAKLSNAQEKPSELTVTVVDEAIFSLVPAPKSPATFFEESPPRPESHAAWSVVSIHAQRGRQVVSEDSYDSPNQYLRDDMALLGGSVMPRAQSISMAPPPGAIPMMMAPAAPKSASPLRAVGMVAAAPVVLVGAGVGLVADAVRRRSEAAEPNHLDEQDAGGGGAAAPVQLRSDFSSEAAWIPNARFARGSSLTLPMKLPDTLTTWKASALLVSLSHDHLLEAHAQVRTQKPLMIRLQAPRFFQERDKLVLRAMVDSRGDKAFEVHTKLEARGFVLPENASRAQTIEPSGQARIDVPFTVPTCQTQEIVVYAEARATNVEDASDAEERKIPYRPYGILLRKTISGVLEEKRTTAFFELPEQRLKELTLLSVQMDRGPLDAVLGALIYLREYPYGCVEQTCSRLLPHLLLDEICKKRDEEPSVYRSSAKKIPEDVVDETLRRIMAMQNADGGFGWWPGCSSDLWMTAYVIFTFSLASRPSDDNLKRARDYLSTNLLKRDHSDDADAFAAFALIWTGGKVSDRVVEVLVSRWDGLSLREKAKLWFVLTKNRHEQAHACREEVREALVGPAKRFLKKVIREDESELQWFHPGSTEAIAFFVLTLLRDGKDDEIDWAKDETLGVLISFLLQHRKGQRWHNTRDSALAVFALLAYEDAVRAQGTERKIDVQINAETKRTVTLERFGAEPTKMEFADEDLQTGKNELAFVMDDVPAGASIMHRHFSAELEYYTQEDEIAATGEGIEIERVYWLLDEKKEPQKKLRNGQKIELGQYVRVVLSIKAAKVRTYLLLEDFKLAGCEPIAKTSGRDVCRGHCAHVELRADRTAIFFDMVGTEWHEVSYDLEAILPGQFTAMPARIETMYEARCYATSASFGLSVKEN